MQLYAEELFLVKVTVLRMAFFSPITALVIILKKKTRPFVWAEESQTNQGTIVHHDRQGQTSNYTQSRAYSESECVIIRPMQQVLSLCRPLIANYAAPQVCAAENESGITPLFCACTLTFAPNTIHVHKYTHKHGKYVQVNIHPLAVSDSELQLRHSPPGAATMSRAEVVRR